MDEHKKCVWFSFLKSASTTLCCGAYDELRLAALMPTVSNRNIEHQAMRAEQEKNRKKLVRVTLLIVIVKSFLIYSFPLGNTSL